MRIIKTLDDAKDFFSEAERALQRAIDGVVDSKGTTSFKQACSHLQSCMTEYTHATRAWGAVEGMFAVRDDEPTLALEELH